MVIQTRHQKMFKAFAIGFTIVWIVGVVLSHEHAAWSLSIGGKGWALVMWIYIGWIPSGLIALLFALTAWLVCDDIGESPPLGPSPETDDDVEVMRRMIDTSGR
ncbi:MAG: hypothetical protein SH850_31545 [Planctomycetaceae bacterium]|nr:hypothetical protein [Planctomycetaceae bacterium]